MSIFRSAVTDSDGAVDAGYLSMFWGLVGWSINNAVILLIAWYAVSGSKDAAALIQATGIALGANAGGFATMLGAVGLFRMGDKPRANTTTTSAQQTSTVQTVPTVA